MTRPLILDLFCGAGGAAVGYHRAGFDVIGVDIDPQPLYPFPFIQADACDPPVDLDAFDAIHASPPCQAFTVAGKIHGNDHHPDLVDTTRQILDASGVPYVIENVPRAPIRPDLILCGSMFDLKSANGHLIRHRWFECSWKVSPMTMPCHHRKPTISVFGHGGHVYHGVDDWREVMEMPWANRDGLAQAIPPAYTEHSGRQLLTHLETTGKVNG
jgi:DNA (cytosine-5)-methyltransferase 1